MQQFTAIHQFHSGASPGDAITNQMFALQGELRSMGFVSNIYAEHFDGEPPFLDPAEPITLARVRKAAKILKKPEAEIRARYVELAERFDLILEFDKKPSKKPQKPASPRG